MNRALALAFQLRPAASPQRQVQAWPAWAWVGLALALALQSGAQPRGLPWAGRRSQATK